ncbi:MAG: hypothetical protein KDK25_04210 [Leptospiraceae bacterium]|nr:hypothetical protein [Leptospiraceae bacterium]
MNKFCAATLLMALALVAGCVQFPEASKFRIEPDYEFDVVAGPSQIQAGCESGELTVTRAVTNKSRCRVQCRSEDSRFNGPWQCQPTMPGPILPGKSANVMIECKGGAQPSGCEEGFDYSLSLNCRCLTEDLDAIDERFTIEGQQKQRKDAGEEVLPGAIGR